MGTGLRKRLKGTVYDFRFIQLYNCCINCTVQNEPIELGHAKLV